MESYLIQVEVNNKKETVIIVAESFYHAVELLLYKHEWHKKQSDITKYKLIN